MALLRGAALVVVVALVLAGCGVGGEEGSDEITAEQLAVMVLPQEELEGAASFPLDEADSGSVNAKEAAESTIDPKDGSSDLRSAGWTAGYELNYTASDTSAMLAKAQGLFNAGSSVDLFDTETSARAFLLRQIRDYERFRGKEREGVRLVSFETFDVDVGDEGWGVEFTARGKFTLHATGVFFRSGRLVATAGYVRADEATMRDAAMKAARALESRIERSLTGELDAKPVPLPNENDEPTQAELSKMTLGLEDLPAGARLIDEGHSEGDDFVSYYRSFDVEQTMIGSSHLMVLRAKTQVYDTKARAEFLMRSLSTSKGRAEFAKGVLRGFSQLTGDQASHVRITRLPGARGDSTGIVVTFDMAGKRFRTATIVVRSGRAVAVVSGFCTAHAVHPGDMPPLGETALTRLSAIPV